jgi:glycosyltransferase involved in cell wall biosynthesis
MNVRKNILAMLKALSLGKDRTISLVLAGATDGRGEDIEAEIRRLHLEKRIIRLGFIADDDLPVLMALATLFCYVSHDEGFGLPVLEAMACGVAVVVSRKEVLQEICGPAGNYVDQDDPSSIADKIDRLLAEPELRQRKVALGLLQCRQFSWGRSAEKLLALCNDGTAIEITNESRV